MAAEQSLLFKLSPFAKNQRKSPTQGWTFSLVAGAGQRPSKMGFFVRLRSHAPNLFGSNLASEPKKKPDKSRTLSLVAGAGLEPATSWL
jgi:hypothetical protein